MTPFRTPAENSPQELFNNKHASVRNVIERCNGVLKARFRCLLGERRMRYQPDKAAEIINVCCALHNMCIKNKLEDPTVPETDEAFVAIGYANEHLEIVQEDNNLRRAGNRNRDILLNYLVNQP
jgi:hypothetical protein